MAFIYRLLDPTDHTIRYVGYTLKPPDQRLVDHRSNAYQRKVRVQQWIADLTTRHLLPLVELVEETNLPRTREVFWIAEHKRLGCSLLNMNNGGAGTTHHTLESRAKMSAAKLGKPGHPLSLEVRRAIGDAQRGVPNSIAQRVHQSEVMTGRKHSDETRQKVVESHARRRLSSQVHPN